MGKLTKVPWGMWFVLVVFAAPLPLAAQTARARQDAASLRAAFEAEYSAFALAPLVMPDLSGGYDSGREYSGQAWAFWRRMAGMGPPVIPLLMEKLKDLNETGNDELRAEFLAYTASTTAARRFVADEWPGGKIGGPREEVDLVLAWWAVGQKATTERFDRLYSEWKRLKVRQSLLSRHNRFYTDYSKTIGMSVQAVTDMGDVYDAITSLGLGALPPMMDKLRAGDCDVLPFIAQITREEATSLDGHEGTLEERARRCLEWWDRNSEKLTIPFPDVVQTTAAGPAVPAQPVTAEKATAPAEPQPKPAQPPSPAE